MASVFLIGDPVAHSLSPAMQNAAFAALGLPHRYELLRVTAEELGSAVERLRRDDVLGANVTIPHKAAALVLLDLVEDTARRIGAVNTISKLGGTLRGENTDVGGFADALAERGVDVAGRQVLLLGAGGAARACIDHLVRSGSRPVIANRTSDRAKDILTAALRSLPAGAMGDRSFGVSRWPVGSVDAFDVVVNATSLGLHGEDALEGVSLRPGLAVVDVVATAQETPLVRRARAAGCLAVDGLIMLLHQGARAFRLWTGVEAPLGAMRAALPRAV